MKDYICTKIYAIMDLDDNDYKAIAKKLLIAVGVSEFFNGKIEYSTDGYDSTLTATLIIYREPLLDPTDPTCSETRITGIAPVWWEFHLYGEGGRELPNAFSWNDLTNYLT